MKNVVNELQTLQDLTAEVNRLLTAIKGNEDHNLYLYQVGDSNTYTVAPINSKYATIKLCNQPYQTMESYLSNILDAYIYLA